MPRKTSPSGPQFGPCRDWRKRSYGRITGAQVERCLQLFNKVWAEVGEWGSSLGDEQQFVRSLEKLVAVPSWINFYQDSLVQLLAKTVAVAGLGDKLSEAFSQEDPISSMLKVADADPSDDVPEHPAAIPLALAMMGNLHAIARYSRSINDMIIACRDRGEIQALFDALSVDSHILNMPFFTAGLRLAQLAGDRSFADAAFKAITGPHAHRLEYAELRWVEYLLRDQDAFESCSREEIYELCVEHLQIYDPGGQKKDAKAALFSRFRTWQKEAGIQNPRFGFSAKRQ